MVSLAFHSHHETDTRLARLPYFLRPIGLEDAVDRMVTDPHLPARVQAAAWLLDGERGLERRRPHFDRIAATLPRAPGAEAPRTEDLLEALREHPPSVSVTGRSDHCRQMMSHVAAHRRRAKGTLASVPALASPGRFGFTYEQLQTHAGCQRRNFRCSVGMDPATQVTSIQAEVEVQRPATDFTVVADPRSWKVSAPLFWQRSDLGNYLAGEFRNDHPELAPGSNSYGDRDLFEAVDLSWNPMFPMQGNNVLRASHFQDPDTRQNVPIPSMSVELGLCLSTTVGFSEVEGGLDVDSGTVQTEELEEGWTRLTATKRARFTERELCGVPLGAYMNLVAQFILGPWMATLVYEGACSP